jgi:hypothetical protein
MFRLWIVIGSLFALGVIAASYSSIRQEFVASHVDYDAIDKKYGGENLLPVNCEKTRGDTSDYSIFEGHCWYTTQSFRKLYPEYKDVSEHDLAEKIYANAGIPLIHPSPWTKLLETLALAFGVPLVVLLLGFSIGWAVSGFCGSTGQGNPEM